MSEATESPEIPESHASANKPRLGQPAGDRVRRAAHQPAALPLLDLRPAADVAPAVQPLLGVQDHRSVAAGTHREVPGQHLDPLHPAHAADLRPAPPQRPVLAADRHLAAARSQRQLHRLPGRSLVLRQRHHDQRFGGADQLGLPGLPLPSAPDDDPELHRFAVDRPVRVRGGQRVVSGGRAGGQGAPADLRRAEEPTQTARRGHLPLPGDDHHVGRLAAAGPAFPPPGGRARSRSRRACPVRGSAALRAARVRLSG